MKNFIYDSNKNIILPKVLNDSLFTNSADSNKALQVAAAGSPPIGGLLFDTTQSEIYTTDDNEEKKSIEKIYIGTQDGIKEIIEVYYNDGSGIKRIWTNLTGLEIFL